VKFYSSRQELKKAVDDHLGMKGRFMEDDVGKHLCYLSPRGVTICRLHVGHHLDRGWHVSDFTTGYKIDGLDELPKDTDREVTKTIETGYKIGGKTWISDLWNAGKLTREHIKDEIADHTPECDETEEELRASLLESEAVFAREQYVDEETKAYDVLLNECVDREMERILNEQNEEHNVRLALQDLYDNWVDNTDDDKQFHLVYHAHHALDTYCRKTSYGEF